MYNREGLNNMDRILMLNYEFPPLGGGGGVAAKNIAKGFIEAGYAVDYVTSWFPGWKMKENVEGINVYRIKVIGRKDQQTATMISMVSFIFLAYKTCRRLCERYNYKFVNTHFVVPTGPLGYKISRKYKIPHVISIHGGDIYDPSKKLSPHKHFIFRMIIRAILNSANHVVAQSSDTRKNAYKYYFTTNDIKIIPLPYIIKNYEIPSRRILSMNDKKKYIISVGRLIRRKNYEDFLRTLQLLPNDIEGIILGDGPEKKHLERFSKELGIQDRFHLPGFVSEEKKFQYLYNSDLYLLTSLHEGFGIVIQEAFQAGLPVVATRHGGQVDLITDNENGFLVDVNDPTNMSEKIMYIINNKNVNELFSTNNVKKVKDFQAKQICEMYLNLFE
ncbi:MAG: glycosyltransferase family 4 protein [bacterium]